MFESVLFIFEFVLFNIISILELYYFNCKLLYFQERIFKRFSLGAKEREIGADSCQKYEDLIQKYLVQRIEDLVQKYNKWCAPYCPFAAFASSTSCLF